MRRTVVRLTALAVLGVAAALAIGLAANAISGDSIGLSARPIRAGEELAPPQARSTTTDDSRTAPTGTTTTRTTDGARTSPPATTTEDRTSNGSQGGSGSSSGSGSSGDSGRGRGRGGDGGDGGSGSGKGRGRGRGSDD